MIAQPIDMHMLLWTLPAAHCLGGGTGRLYLENCSFTKGGLRVILIILVYIAIEATTAVAPTAVKVTLDDMSKYSLTGS